MSTRGKEASSLSLFFGQCKEVRSRTDTVTFIVAVCVYSVLICFWLWLPQEEKLELLEDGVDVSGWVKSGLG